MRNLMEVIHWTAGLWCYVGWHDWRERSIYRRGCHYCPKSQTYLPDEGWVDV